MKKILLFSILILLTFLSWSKDLPEVQFQNATFWINEHYTSKKEYQILDSIKGQFTDSDNEQYLIFVSYTTKIGTYWEIEKTLLMEFDDNAEVICCYDVDYDFVYSNPAFYSCETLGEPMSQGWIVDLNGNGKQELIFTQAAGSFMTWQIIEFVDGKFKAVLPEELRYNEICGADFSKKTIFIEHSFYTGKMVVNILKLSWNEEKQMYEESLISSQRR